jgi:hypothetical protein
MYSRILDPGSGVFFYPQDAGSGSGMKNLDIRIRDKNIPNPQPCIHYIYNFHTQNMGFN